MNGATIERMVISSKAKARGFSLIEILISLAILGFGLLAVAKLQGTLIASGDHARQITEAINIGQDKLEELRSFSAIDTGPGFSYVDISPTLCIDPVSGAGASANFALKCEVDPENYYKTVKVRVSWTDQKNGDQSVTLISQISRTDPAVSGKLMLADGAGAIPFP